MKRAFVRATDGHLVSELVPLNTPNVFQIGDRIVATRPLDLGYYAQIERGEQGTVEYIDEHTGFVEILMDKLHRGLFEYGNCIWLEPFGTEDILDGIMCVAAYIALRSVG
jgi:hypothetical protein